MYGSALGYGLKCSGLESRERKVIFLLSQTVQTASVEPTQPSILGYRDSE
jgi:hypothetical protein